MEVINIISKAYNKKLKITQSPKRIRPQDSEVMNLVSSNKEAMKFLNWKPKYSGKLGLEKGIKKTIEFLENNKLDNNENKKFVY